MHKKGNSQDFLIQKGAKQSTQNSFFSAAQDVDRLSQKKRTEHQGTTQNMNSESQKFYQYQIYNKDCDYKSEIVLNRYRKDIKTQDSKDSKDSNVSSIKIIQHKNKQTNINFDENRIKDIQKPNLNLLRNQMYEKRNKSQLNSSIQSGKDHQKNSAKSFVIKSDENQFHNSQVFHQNVKNKEKQSRNFDQDDFKSLGSKYILQTNMQELEYLTNLRNYEPKSNQIYKSNQNTKLQDMSLVDKLKFKIQNYSRKTN